MTFNIPGIHVIIGTENFYRYVHETARECKMMMFDFLTHLCQTIFKFMHFLSAVNDTVDRFLKLMNLIIPRVLMLLLVMWKSKQSTVAFLILNWPSSLKLESVLLCLRKSDFCLLSGNKEYIQYILKNNIKNSTFLVQYQTLLFQAWSLINNHKAINSHFLWSVKHWVN